MALGNEKKKLPFKGQYHAEKMPESKIGNTLDFCC